ncbi:glutaredoxin family protein [Ornithinibacillus salinisoli]|uniref:Glutaredoxin family protein n=1 Tax=Ornithinibacillus salinisoli TaxID=1848459 RepID=A0ABW4VZ50_9BACI
MKQITVYISDDCIYCEKLIYKLHEWGIDYQLKNVSKQKAYMKQLQEQGIYGTPVTYSHQSDRYILGLQFGELKKELNIG